MEVKNKTYCQLHDHKWLRTLMFFDDFNVHFNKLNIKLQNFRIHLVRYLVQAAGRLG